ncbi:hypothetical protein FACS1894219_06000 [Clostridia bacterium]|nr:hypothetical protein FACS1894219_06000 [Clostridia bacterium]
MELSDILSSVLSDPAMMEKIRALTSSAGSAAAENIPAAATKVEPAAVPAAATKVEPAAVSAAAPQEPIERATQALGKIREVTAPEANDHAKLLLALKPFLKENRRSKIDTAVKYMNAAKILKTFGKDGFV